MKSRTRPAARSRFYPYALISRHGMPKVEGFYILHEGPIGVVGDAGLQEMSYADATEGRRVARPSSRPAAGSAFTDKYWAAALVPIRRRPTRPLLRGAKASEPKDTLPGRLLGSAPSLSRPVRAALGIQQPVCRRQAGHPHPGLRREARRRAVRPADRLGLVLVHHQAAVQAAALAGLFARQLRPRHPRHHRAREGRVLPAGQQELRVDGQDEEASAGDGEDRASASRTIASSSSRS